MAEWMKGLPHRVREEEVRASITTTKTDRIALHKRLDALETAWSITGNARKGLNVRLLAIEAATMLLLALAPALVHADVYGSAVVRYEASNPTGGCTNRRLWWNTASNVLWVCESGTWVSTLGAAPVFTGGAITSTLDFEGATANEFETTLTVVDPTADRTITLPNFSGTLLISSTANEPDTSNAVWANTGSLLFEGSTANGFETELDTVDPTADRTIMMPDASGTALLVTPTSERIDITASAVGTIMQRTSNFSYEMIARNTTSQLYGHVYFDTDAGGSGLADIAVSDVVGQATGGMSASSVEADLYAGDSSTSAHFKVSGDGARLETSGTKPTCSATTRGRLWRIEGDTGVADTFEVCRKDAGDAYAWVSLF